MICGLEKAPKSTCVSAVKPCPLIVTSVPPASGPCRGENAVTTSSSKYVKQLLQMNEPFGF